MVRSEGDIDAAIDAIARTPDGSIIVTPQAFFMVHRTRLIEFGRAATSDSDPFRV
jgi:hypothetical protein